jgi:capsular polysaccharide export protein
MSKYITISQALIENSQNFLNIKKSTLLKSIKYLFFKVTFVGWGRKKSGVWATKMAKLTRGDFLLLEDGFIRSFGLGVEGSPSFSVVKDDIGIYYDATCPSRLEEILNSYDFKSARELMSLAKEARAKIIEYKISKYNNFKEVDLSYLDNGKEKILIVAQTYGDSSLEYGLGNTFSTKEMLDDAIRDNPHAEVYIKIHPDVLTGKKESDIHENNIPSSCYILTDNANPIELMGYFDKVYTKTSGMGFEALLLNKEVHCYGLPFYAGWGITFDKVECSRRERNLSIDEIFTGAYILYSCYYNPYLNEESDILKIIEYIAQNRKSNHE